MICQKSLLENTVSYDIQDSYFGVFHKSIEDFQKEYRKVLWNPFLPFSFRNQKNIIKAYLPCYYCNTHLEGVVDYYCKDKKSSNKYQVQMKINADYKNEFISLNQICPTTIINSVSDTFQYEQYRSDLLRNSIILDKTVEEELEKQKYYEELTNQTLLGVKGKVPHDLKKVNNKNISINDTSYRLVYLPIYLKVLSYQNKKYYFIMNGEDGKVFFSSVFSKISMIIFILIIFFVVFLLTSFIIRMI